MIHRRTPPPQVFVNRGGLRWPCSIHAIQSFRVSPLVRIVSSKECAWIFASNIFFVCPYGSIQKPLKLSAFFVCVCDPLHRKKFSEFESQSHKKTNCKKIVTVFSRRVLVFGWESARGVSVFVCMCMWIGEYLFSGVSARCASSHIRMVFVEKYTNTRACAIHV